MEAETDTEAMEGWALLIFLFLVTFSVCFLVTPRTTNPGMAPLTMGRALPH